MNQLQMKKRNELIGQFVVAAKPQDITQSLLGLIRDFGHDEDAQRTIIHQLDDLFAKDGALARDVTFQAVLEAHDAHTSHRKSKVKDVAEIEGCHALEKKLALLWRQMLMNDPSLSPAQKQDEARRVEHVARTSSSLLVAEAQEVAKSLRQNLVHAVQPW